MRTPPLLADLIHPGACKPICEKLLTLPLFSLKSNVLLSISKTSTQVERKMRALRKPVLDAHILSIQKRIQELEQEIDAIVM